MSPRRPGALLFALLALASGAGSCGGSGDEELSRLIVDCASDEDACDDVKNAGCSVVLAEVDAEGNVVGYCGDTDERRVCTRHCDGDSDCPDGWNCLLPDNCPGDNAIQFCVPSATELQLQELESCRADASPRVCGFF